MESKQDIVNAIELTMGEILGLAKMTKAGLESVRYCISKPICLSDMPEVRGRKVYEDWLKPSGVEGLKNLTIAGMKALGTAIKGINDVENEEKERPT